MESKKYNFLFIILGILLFIIRPSWFGINSFGGSFAFGFIGMALIVFGIINFTKWRKLNIGLRIFISVIASIVLIFLLVLLLAIFIGVSYTGL